MQAEIRELFHYPVKGLSAQPLEVVDLLPGQGFPLDRAFGFARPGSGFDPQNPRPLPKSKFVVLAQEAALALLRTRYDPDEMRLMIGRSGEEVSFDIGTPEGRHAASAWLAEDLGLPADMAPTLHSAGPHKFTDVSVVSPSLMNAVSLINLDSVADLAARTGQDISPARFRANILFSGVSPFAELDWIGRILAIGSVRLEVVMRTKRCPATEVNPRTAERDIDIPALLKQQFDHSDTGVYAEVRQGGRIRRGDGLTLV